MAALQTERSSRSLFNSVGHPTENERLVVEWLDWCDSVRNMQPSTLVSYAGTVGALVGWCGHKRMRLLSAADLEQFTLRKRRGRTPSPATRRREVATLRAFWQWMIDAGKLDPPNQAALLGSPKVPKRNPNPVSDQTWMHIWTNLELESEIVFLGLGYFCGLRRAELSALRADQVTASHIKDFIRKGGGDHTMPWAEVISVYADCLPSLLPDDTVFTNALSTLRNARRGQALLPWGDDTQALNRRMDRICHRVGVERVTPHQMRHSACTNLLRAGVPLHLVASLMNHSSVTITMGYVRAGGGELAEWRQQLRSRT